MVQGIRTNCLSSANYSLCSEQDEDTRPFLRGSIIVSQGDRLPRFYRGIFVDIPPISTRNNGPRMKPGKE